MQRCSTTLLLMALGTIPAAGQLHISIAVCDSAGLREETRVAMKEETSKILSAAGVEVAWLEPCTIAKPVALETATL